MQARCEHNVVPASATLNVTAYRKLRAYVTMGVWRPGVCRDGTCDLGKIGLRVSHTAHGLALSPQSAQTSLHTLTHQPPWRPLRHFTHYASQLTARRIAIIVCTPSSVLDYLWGSLSRSKNSGYAWLSLPVESTKMLGVCNESTMLS